MAQPAKRKLPDDDLFQETTMTFGEHLEELRGSLFRAVAGLVIGVLIGMLAASFVVDQVKAPLEQALRRYYVESAILDFNKRYEAEGGLPDSIINFMRENLVAFEEVYVEAREVQRVMTRVGLGTANEAGTNDLPNDEPTASPPTIRVPPPKSETEPRGDEPAQSKPAQSKPAQSKPAQPPPDLPPAEESDEEPDPVPAVSPDNTPAPAATTSAPAEAPAAAASGAAGSAAKFDIKEAAKEKLPLPTADLFKARVWRPIDTRVTSLNAQEAFMIWLKAGLIAGVVIAGPWIFYQLWVFVAAGLYPHEKKYIYVFLPFSLFLFFAGVGLAFFFVFDPVLDFLFSFNRTMKIDPDPRISEWLSFVLLLPLGFGISFQLPLVMLFLHRVGIFEAHAYIEKWRIAILAIFIISMVLTPADPVSMLLMACPLTVLYFLGIGLCLWMPKIQNPYSEGYEP